MHAKNESLTIIWCDAGSVDGLFADGIVKTILAMNSVGIQNVSSLRVHGNQIARQRQAGFDVWADTIKSDWLLWVDSDIVIGPEVFKKLWNSADKVSVPVISGLYFISKKSEHSLMEPMPVIFNETGDEFSIEIINNIPNDKVITADCAGFGFVLMHKSIIDPLRKVSPDYSLFAEKAQDTENFVGEDIAFFRNLKKAGIKLHVHSGAYVPHMKRFAYDINYHNLYWSSVQEGKIKQI